MPFRGVVDGVARDFDHQISLTHLCLTGQSGFGPESRLSCQAQVGETNLVVEIPRYTINHASERH